MKTRYHREITNEALEEYCVPSVLQVIVEANIGQDSLIYQFGHDHFHFDNNSFAASNRYCEDLHLETVNAVRKSDYFSAWKSFGKLTHTVQDLYAHSNYVKLWKQSRPGTGAEVIDPVSNEILGSIDLRSGRLYYPLEILSFVKPLQPLVLPFLPKDSHAWMNIDSPDRPDYVYAKKAAILRTCLEFNRLTEEFSMDEKQKFTGK